MIEVASSADFQKVMRLVSSACDNRLQAAVHGGSIGETLERVAAQRSKQADDVLKRIMGGTDGIGAKATDPVARASRG